MADEMQGWTGRYWRGGTILRTTILILTSLLIGMGLGGFLPPATARMYAVIGVYGLLAYLALTLVAHYRARRGQSLRQAATEQRAEQRLQSEAHLLNRRS